MPPDESSPAPPSAARQVALGALGAWLLLGVAAVAAGDALGALWSGAALALLVATVWCARWPAFRRASAVAIALYTLGLTAATLVVGWTGASDDARVQLFASNPNVLAAALVGAFCAWVAVAPKRRWVWWGWPLVALAVLHTGSRTAGGALLVAGIVWLVVQAVGGRSRWAWAPVVAVVALAAAAFAWQYGVVERTPNLLEAPSDLSDRAWRLDLAASVEVRDEGAAGPFPGTLAQRLLATARPTGTHLAHQSIGRSEEGVPYVASIFLRSDTPQRFVLTSHLASVRCEVGPEWSRCVTPVGFGDDHAQRQIHLRAPTQGGSVDVEVFGAQYERGTEVTPFLDARPSWIPQTMVNRFDLRRITFLPENRLPPWQAGVALFREQPWFGVGPTAAPEAFLERTGRTMRHGVTYAHNLVVQWLAVHGLIGVAGIALVAAATLSLLRARAWSRLAPLLVALVLLNTWDVTFHEPLVFAPALLALALWMTRGDPVRVRARVATRSVIVIGLALVLCAGGLATASGAATDGLWARVHAAVDELPRERFDAAAVVTRVGTDPLDLFAWVRDETAWLPYEGALKGPIGTLLDRAGSTLDRALLLHELLVVAGHDPQLVSAVVRAGQVVEFASATGGSWSRARSADAPAHGSAADLADRAASELGSDRTAVERALSAAERNRSELHETLRTRTDRHVDALATALDRAGVPTPEARAEPDERPHWWVRLELPGGDQLDLDPTLPDARPGDVLAALAATHRIATLRDLATLDGPCPDLACGDRLHTLVVRAVVEVASGGTVEEHVVLEYELLPAELFGVPLALGVRATGGGRELAPFDTVDPASALREALLEHDEWQPVLMIGDDAVATRAVTAAGEVLDEPGERPAARSAGPLGGFGAIGGARSAPAAPDGMFTALWWEFEVRSPGAVARAERRAVFDLVGPAARAAGDTSEPSLDDHTRLARALALVGHTEVLAAPAAPTGELLSLWAASRLLAERDAWDALHAHGLDAPMPLVNERLAALAALVRSVDRLALERGRALHASGGAQTGLLVVLRHQTLRSDLRREGGFDLVFSAPDANATFRASNGGWGHGLRPGVLDTNLEALLAAAAGPAPPGGSLADVFDRDPSAWRAVTEVDSLAELGVLPPELEARVRADLGRGYVAVVPLDARDGVGWWRIDPVSFEAIGFGDRGWGQAMTGYAARANVVLQLRGVLQQYGSMGQCLGLAIVQPLRGIEGVGDELAQCVFELVCGALIGLAGEFADADENWTNVILMNTIGALWGGVGETGFGGVCGGLWEHLAR